MGGIGGRGRLRWAHGTVAKKMDLRFQSEKKLSLLLDVLLAACDYHGYLTQKQSETRKLVKV